MTVQSPAPVSVTIVWDDPSWTIISFTDPTSGTSFNTGFPSSNQDWLETVKDAVRNGRNLTLVYDDSSYTPYTAPGTGTNYNIQNLFNLHN